MSTISIAGLDKTLLLQKMWNKMPPAAFYTMYPLSIPEFDLSQNTHREEAEKAVLRYIDYFRGRCIKTDLSRDEITTRGFNRDAGENALEEIVASMRKAGS
jgi:hypothetical protein